MIWQAAKINVVLTCYFATLSLHRLNQLIVLTFLYQQNEYIRHYRTNSPLHHDILLISKFYIQGLKIVLYQSIKLYNTVTPALRNTNAGRKYMLCRIEVAILAQY